MWKNGKSTIKKWAVSGVLLLSVAAFYGCSSVPENTVHSLEDLEGKKIGVQLKTTGDVYATDIKDAQVQRFNKGRDAVAALQAGEIDAVMLDDGPAKVFCEEFDHIRVLDEAYAEEEYGLVVKKGNTELQDQINTALEKLKEDGTLARIEDNWINEGTGKSLFPGETGGSHANGKLVVVTNAEFPPYESVGEDETIIGFDIDLMYAICDQLDMELEIQNIAFDSVISALDREIADVGATAMSITEERQAQVDFSNPYFTAKQVILVREDKK